MYDLDLDVVRAALYYTLNLAVGCKTERVPKTNQDTSQQSCMLKVYKRINYRSQLTQSKLWRDKSDLFLIKNHESQITLN